MLLIHSPKIPVNNFSTQTGVGNSIIYCKKCRSYVYFYTEYILLDDEK